MMLEELSVRFSADIAPFSAAVSQVQGMLSALGGAADGITAQFQTAGAMAGEGLKNGLLSQRAAVAAAAQMLAQAAANALRGALQIHSPSRLTYEVGRFFDEGLLEGIRGSADRVAAEAGNLGKGAAFALQDAAVQMPLSPAADFSAARQAVSPDQALSSLSLTVPLEIDGYRLGVAAIEGINRVAKGTGRVELML